MPPEKPRTRTSEKKPIEMKVALPGDAYQRAGRWWWRVRLPGEEKARARLLKAPGAQAAACDQDAAEKAALEMWEQAVRQDGARQITIDCTQKVERLKAQFLDKVRHLTEIVETANARAEAEARARGEIEARLNAMLRTAGPGTEDRGRKTEDGGRRTAISAPEFQTPIVNSQVSTPCPAPTGNHPPKPQVGFCECCGAADVPATDLKQIDSGQRLCPDCLNALHSDASRAESDILAESLG